MSRNTELAPNPGRDDRLDRQSHKSEDNLCHVDRVKLLKDAPMCKVSGIQKDPADKHLPSVTVPNGDKEPAKKAETLLLDHSAKAEDRLKAARELVHQGIHSFKVKDDKGQESTVRLDSGKAGSREMVHVFINDGKHERVALRGNFTDKGMEEQKDAHGNHVKMEGKGAESFNRMRLADDNKEDKSRLDAQDKPRPNKDKGTAADGPDLFSDKRNAIGTGPRGEGKPDVAPLPPQRETKRDPSQDIPPQPVPHRETRRDPSQDIPPQPVPPRREQGQEPRPIKRPDNAESQDRRPRQDDQSFFPDNHEQRRDNARIASMGDKQSFYKHQTTPVDCSAVSMGQALSDHKLGRPLTENETIHMRQLAGVTQHGYRGSLGDMSRQLHSVGLNAQPYETSGNFDQRGMAQLNRELDAGHSAVARVINYRTGNPHYIYVHGRDSHGNYIIGDPDRRSNLNAGPISPDRLYGAMRGRNGFVAVW